MQIRKRSQLQEKRVAEDLGGRVQKASGATDFAKGDVRKFGSWRVECKTTSKKSFSLKLSEIKKVRLEGLTSGEEWAMQIEFQGQVGLNRKVAVIDWELFKQLIEKLPETK